MRVPDHYERHNYQYEGMYNRNNDYQIPLGCAPDVSSRMFKASQVFREQDRDRSGSLDRNEFLHAMMRLGWDVNSGDKDRLWRLVDLNGSGTITEREFTEFWAHCGF